MENPKRPGPVSFLNETFKQTFKEAGMVRLANELITVHKAFIDKLEEVKTLIDSRIGPKGDRGDEGHTPTTVELQNAIVPLLPTVDELKAIIEPLIPVAKDGEPGKSIDEATVEKMIKKLMPIIENKGQNLTEKDITKIVRKIMPALDHDKIARKVLAILPSPAPIEFDIEGFIEMFATSGKKLQMTHIEGLEEYMKSIKEQAGRTGAYLHGGGDTVKAGANTSLVRNKDGTTTINATGGLSPLLITSGVIDDSNKVFGFPQQPNFVIVNGTWYMPTGGAITFTWNSGTLQATLSTPVGTGGSIFGA